MKINQLSKCAGIGVFFLFANMNAQSTEKVIKNFIQNDVSFRNNTDAEFKILNEDHSASLKSNIVNVQQYYGKTPIYKSLAKAVIQDGRIVSFNNNFQKVGSNVISDKIGKNEALSAALTFLNIKDSGFEIIDETSENLVNLPDNKVASIRFYFEKNNSLIPAQLFFINQSKENKFFGTLVSLTTGEILENNKMIDECSFGPDDFAALETYDNTEHLINHLNNNISAGNHSKAAADASYNVFPFPIEAPTFGPRSIVNNPWDLTASPEGWHSNGTTTFTNTTGNNVFAYVDNNASNNTNGFSPQSTTTGSLTFDFPFAEGTTLSAYDNRSSAVTNLFYANNMVHDIFYKFGFTETSRNFQTNNFGKGGGQGDAVRAEAFDGSGYNNANFASGYEILNTVTGNYSVQAPRMQMYLWNYSVPIKQRLFYNDPTLATRPAVNSGTATYGSGGKYLMETGVTGDLAIPNVTNGCTAITAGSLAGKIALITSLGCTYDVKIKNAQAAGAIGVLIHRTNSNVATDMYTENGTGITIPAIMVANSEGTFVTSELTAGRTVNVTLKDIGTGYKNSSFDNGVMIHEYGHGISNRLTGQGYSCLTSVEQMGEGWSDFFALMLTNSPGATADVARGIGTYSTNTATTAAGIRNFRYSPDLNVNPNLYNTTNLVSGAHAIGAIWATMLWDLHWKMAEKYGYNSNVAADPNSGSAKTLQLVMDGLKLQPCNPDFISGRDAILQADQLAGGADNCLIWNVFARRGLGVNASAGSATNAADQVNGFNVPEACVLATDEIAKNKAFGIYPNPAKGEFFIKAAPTVGNTTVKVEILDLNGKLIKSLERKKNSSESISTKGLIKGIYLVVITENGKSNAEKLIVE